VWINSYGTQREMRSKSLPLGQTSSMGGAFGHNDQKRSPCQAETGGLWGEGKELEGKGEEAGLVQIERTGGAGARTVKDMEVDHGCLMTAAAATLRALLR